jgi:hypothetical protein
MRPDDGGVDDRARLIDFELQCLENPRPNAALRPIRKPVVDGLPGTEPLGQIAPCHSGLRSVEHCVDEQSIATRRLRPRPLVRKKPSNSFPLLVAQRMAMHAQL